MKRTFKYFLDSIITSLIGTATMVITLILVFTGDISFKWDGAIGLGIGCLLVMTPRAIEKIIIEGLKAWGHKANSWITGNDNNDKGAPQNNEEIKSE